MGDKEDLTNEEIVPESEDNTEFELSDEEETYADTLKRMREKLKECERLRSASQEELQRAKAEYLNARKRQEESLKQTKENITNTFVRSLLPLCDSFDMAMADTDAWQRVDESWRVGVESIHTQLQATLKEHGVESIDPIGQPFDPELHEAISTTDSEKETDTVIDVVQKGYSRNGHVIRPAKVILSN